MIEYTIVTITISTTTTTDEQVLRRGFPELTDTAKLWRRTGLAAACNQPQDRPGHTVLVCSIWVKDTEGKSKSRPHLPLQ